MSGVFPRPILNNEPVSKWKRGNDYAAPESPESPEAPEEDPIMAGQGATAKHIAAIIAQVTLAMSQERDEEEDNKSIYMVHQAELENDKCYSDEEEYDEGLYMVHQAEFENGKCSSYEEEYEKSIHLADLWIKYER